MLICLDGLDGAGKTTVAAALVKRLEEWLGDGVTSVTSRHLPERPYAELKASCKNTVGLAFQYISDMMDVAGQDVAKIASKTDWVVWDRGIFSTMVYQGAAISGSNSHERLTTARKILESYYNGLEMLFELHGLPYATCMMNVLIDTPVAVCIHRVRARCADDPYECAPGDVWAQRSYDYYKYMSIFGTHIVQTVENTPVYAIVDEIWDKCIKEHIRGHNG